MSYDLDAAIDIAASPARVWAVLADFSRYPDWNPFIRSITGVQRVDEHLRVHIVPPGGKGMVFKPRVLAVEPERELRWKGRLLFPGLFDGEHRFRITPNNGGVRFRQSETFTGLLVALIPASLWTQTKAGFEAMNEMLKQRAESHAP